MKSEAQSMKFGFVGLGQMGAPMAINLAQEHDVLVYDRNTSAVANVERSGAKGASEPCQFADVDVLITCLPAAKIVNSALFDSKAGLVQHLKAGTLVVDTSTIEYGATLEFKSQLQTADLRFLDAPVSGMQKRAEDGSLTMMVGGDVSDLAEVQGALSTMASKILHMGDVGAGQLTKLINQLLFDINAAALAEILPLSVKLGIDPEQVAEVVNSGTGRSYASEFFVPNILQGDFRNGYPMQAAYKDLISGAEISAHHNIPTPVLAAATATYQQALLEGHGDKDKGGMILVFERLLGTDFRAATFKEDKA
jgi:3-hydroxyisobutyrate dehydrogenase-like beta-hydroxyacid dehydrogenase